MAPHVLIMGAHGFLGRGLARKLVTDGWKVTGVCRSPHDKLEALKNEFDGKFSVFCRNERLLSPERSDDILSELRPDMVVWSGAPETSRGNDAMHACTFAHIAAKKNFVSRYLHLSYIGGRSVKPSWWSNEEWEKCKRGNERDMKTRRFTRTHRVADEHVYLAGKKRGGDYASVALRTPLKINFDGPLKVSLGKTPTFGELIGEDAIIQTAATLLDVPNLKSGWLDLNAGDDSIEDAVLKVADQGINSAEGEPVHENLEERLAEIEGATVDPQIFERDIFVGERRAPPPV